MRTALDVVLAKQSPTEAELRGMARDVRGAVGDAERLIEALLTLARNERGLTVHEEVDLATVAEDALDVVPPRGRHRHPALAPALTRGDLVLSERLVANLVDNATRYNRPGGDVWVSTGTADGRATVEVANTGSAVPADAVGALFRPFHRLHGRNTADGSGLGLAIVSSIAAAHHGTIAARPRPEGGLHVTVTLPLRPDRPASATPCGHDHVDAGQQPAAGL